MAGAIGEIRAMSTRRGWTAGLACAFLGAAAVWAGSQPTAAPSGGAPSAAAVGDLPPPAPSSSPSAVGPAPARAGRGVEVSLYFTACVAGQIEPCG
jgi:hypothetical protein